MKLRDKKKRKILLNITSLIDVLFLLLIFFMVSSTFIEKPGMDLELPESESSALKEIKDMVLFIGPDEKMVLNDTEISIQTLKERLEAEHQLNPTGALILRGDKAVTLGRTVNIMDIAKQVGITKLIIATQDSKKKQ